jgi:hypothetical protein
MKNRWLFVAVAAASALGLYAQSDATGGELALFGGGTSNLGVHPFAGASSGIAFSKYAAAILDVSYARFNRRTLRYLPDQQARNSNLYDFNISAHIRYPISRKWAPYGILGPSLLWNSYDQYARGPGGSTFVAHRDDVNFGFHTGGGVRYHINEHVGIRPEVRVVISNQTFIAFSLGFFFNVESGL